VGITKGELESAKRRALNLFDKWNDVTGFVPKHTGYYYELQSVIEDAVHCGAQAAVGVHELLESEKDEADEPVGKKPTLAEQGRAIIADADAAIAKSNAKPEEAYREASAVDSRIAGIGAPAHHIGETGAPNLGNLTQKTE
jgi:hypothetical protein